MNKEANVAYLMNGLDDAAWKKALEQNETKFLRKKEIGQILQTLATAGSDMMNRIYERARDTSDSYDDDKADEFIAWLFCTAVPELEQLRAFGNDSLLALAKRDRMAVPQFEANWSWKGLRAIYAKKSAVAIATETHGPTEMIES
jgi:hypothetical protein